MKLSERIRKMKGYKPFDTDWYADEVAKLEAACLGALRFLTGNTTKFSERNRAAVKEKLMHALGMEEKRNVLNTIRVMADYGSAEHLLCIIANELAELNEFLGKRMPEPMSREDFEEMMRKQ